MEQAAQGTEFPLRLADALSVESFDAPIFACICSDNLNQALPRLSHYKRLIGPMVLDVDITKNKTTATISCYGNTSPLPSSLGASEMVFFTQLSRIATRHHIIPLEIQLENIPKNPKPYEAYFGCKLTKGNCVRISFSAEDAVRPFLTSNVAMWNYFEEGLNKRLADLEAEASVSERVRAVLIETLPSGDASIERVADKLAMSKRTLQRKLTAEGISFQNILQEVRENLADHYLSKSKLSLGEISFLLGFQESNSFIRAFSGWKGISPGSYREQRSYH